ncbi:DUF2226 domain-containing protein [Thermococcus sp. MV11]|uniref:DUF2226 domain-containing protein n=1 Tax=Thermococcus sp. MV11 TaxID=1638267 RepID=UPI00142FB308|nr:DUF2226 domain-containing protein [Thermococcus sp. MV11]NJE03389.1 DUF2226 domain-containing protein [Thermococcus sp. MV11]
MVRVMFSGRLVRIETRSIFPEVLKDLGEGYVLFSWRDGEDLKRAFIFVASGRVIGAFVEAVISGYSREGNNAIDDIETALSKGLVKAFEVYEAEVGSILSERPTLAVSSFPLMSLRGNEIQELLKLYRSFSGWLQIKSGDREWHLAVQNGITLRAHLLSGNLLGDDAVLFLLREFDHVIKNGVYRFFSGEGSFPVGSEVFEHSTSFLDVAEAIKLKMDIEAGLAF